MVTATVKLEEWAAVILKGCEQVTTPSALQSHCRNSGSRSAAGAGVEA